MSAPSPSVISAHEIVKNFGYRRVLNRLSFDVEAGCLVALTGHNGSGKSTLIRILAGLLRPSSGSILLDGKPVFHARKRALAGYVGHECFLYGDLTTRENLVFFAQLCNVSTSRVDEVLDDWALKPFASYAVRTLSRGLTQRAALARALIARPPVLFLDEPYTGLDAASKERLDARLLEEKKRGTAMVVAVHDPDFATRMATHVLHLKHGDRQFWGEAEGFAGWEASQGKK